MPWHQVLGRGRTGHEPLVQAGPVRVVEGVLSHVPCQVGLLGITLPTDVAYVGLQMLGLGVLGYMLPQAHLISKALVTRITSVWLVGHV